MSRTGVRSRRRWRRACWALSLLLTLLATPVFYTLFEDATSTPRWIALRGRLAGALGGAWAAARRLRGQGAGSRFRS